MLSKYEARDVILGIRPEHISLEQPDTNSVSMSIKIEVIELLGNEMFIYFNVAGALKTARTSSVLIPDKEKMIDIYLRSEKLKFFDPSTNLVI